MRSGRNEDSPNMPLALISAVLLASLLSILLLLGTAVLLKNAVLPASSIDYLLPALRVIGGAAAALLCVRRCKRRLWLWGGLAGLGHAIFSILLFSILADAFAFTPALPADLAVGLLAGLLAVLVRQTLH